MGAVSIKTDWVEKDPPKADSGDQFNTNPQLAPYEKPIPEGADWNATNDTGPEDMNKAQPFKNQGAGYTD